MIKQIIIDENSVVQACSIGGYIANGIDVDDIPQAVMDCPNKYCYGSGIYSVNPAYNAQAVLPPEITVADLAAAVAELAEVIANG